MSGDLIVVAGAVGIVCGGMALLGWLCERIGGPDVWTRWGE